MADPRIQIVTMLTRTVLPPGIVIGIVGNSLNIAVLKRAKLYNHPCSRYFLALSTNNLFFSIFLLTFNLLANGYQLDPTSNSRLWCKVILYVQQTSITISPYFIVLAAFDRYCASSSNVQRRNLSNLTFARWSIISLLIVLPLFYISSLVMLDLQPGQAVPCRIIPGSLYSRIYPIIQTALLCLIPPFLMLVFGMLTISNTAMVRVAPTISSRYRRTEHQLARMLFAQVACQIIFCSPLCAIYILGFLPVQYLSPIEFFFAFRITQLIFSLSYTASVILYFLSARIYRNELVNIIMKLLRLKRNNRIGATGFTGNTIPMHTLQVSYLAEKTAAHE